MLCQQNWNSGIATSAKNLALELAKSNRVLYVNMPLDINTVIRGHQELDVKHRLRVLFGQSECLVQSESNVWVLTPRLLGLSFNWLPFRQAFKALNRLNSEMLAASIRKAVRTLGFDAYNLLQDGIIFQGLEMKRLLTPVNSIYYIRDYTLAVPYFKRHGEWVEAELIRQADAVVTNSKFLNDYAQKHNPHSYNIGQGYALSMYQAEAEYAVPADLAAIPGPTITYTGYLTDIRLDLQLLLTIAQRRPDWQLVFIGPENEVFERSALHQLPNVHFLGSKLPQELAAYLRHSDVCINPQIINDITIGNYPLKIDEYLAMGKPVVATATSAMDMFAQHVYLALGPDQWLAQLEAALRDHSPERAQERIAFAKSHTWEAFAQKLYAVIAATAVATQATTLA
jgi:teichuronic acid biosynthesis glycosyltransferase TuaH